MKRTCAFCDKELNTAAIEADAPITHGLCKDCISRFNSSPGKPLRDYLDSIPAPVILVDSDRRIRIANRRACEYLGKELPEMEGFRGGDVFECENARLPGGCGKTVHCSGCAIRRAVLDTLILEKAHEKSPAYLNRRFSQRTQRLVMQISTEKIQGLVLLRIDEIRDEDDTLLTHLNIDR
jgi:PAS domain-containing protein